MSQLLHKSGAVSIRRADGRVVGKVTGGVFAKRVQASKHFLRTPPAICFDTDVLMQARDAGAVWCEVEDTESGRVYRASIHEVLQRGFSFDRGHGAQVALPLDKWVYSADAPSVQMEIVFSFN